MPIQWSNDLSVGVSAIDSQHKDLISRINTLSSAMQQGKGKEEIAKLIGYLGDYTVRHFADEEKLMTDKAYPSIVSHKALHSAFITTFLRLKGDFESKGVSSSLTIELNSCVGDWLRSHIAKVDKEYAIHMKSIS